MTREVLKGLCAAGAYAAVALGACLAGAIVGAQPTRSPEQPKLPPAEDRPLLTTVRQVQDAQLGAVAFDAAGEHYVVDGLPREYLYDSAESLGLVE